jgi:hypothetical protein
MNHNDIMMRVVMHVVVPVVVMLVDYHVWFVSNDDFIGTYHGCEC